MQQIGIFDESIREAKLEKLGDPLKRLNEVMDREMFRPVLKKRLRRNAERAVVHHSIW